MDAALSIALGYFVGSLSPSSLVGRVKKTDVRKSGTGNLGSTNTMLVLGWGAGIFVMLFDLMKSFLSGKLAQYLFPGLSVAGMLACIGAMIGHCFPVFHRFRGGKGLAAFGGLVIYCGLKYVPIVLCAGWAVMWIFDCTVMFPITVGIALPLLMYLFGEAPAKIITAICAGAVLDVMHIGNMKKALAGDEIMHVRGYFSEKLHKERCKVFARKSESFPLLLGKLVIYSKSWL